MKNFLCVLMVGGLLAASLCATAATKKKPKKKSVAPLRVVGQVTVVGSVAFTPESGGGLKIDVIVASGAPATTFNVKFGYTVVGGPASTISFLGHLETDQEGTGEGHYQVDLSSIARLRIIPRVYMGDPSGVDRHKGLHSKVRHQRLLLATAVMKGARRVVQTVPLRLLPQ